MRSSSLYNEFVTADRVRQLHSLYIFDYALGDQDWFSELGFSHPNLFHILSCQFNRQTSIQVCENQQKLNVWSMNLSSTVPCATVGDGV